MHYYSSFWQVLHDITMLFTQYLLILQLSPGYEDDIFEDIFNLLVQRSKFGRKMEKFYGKYFQKVNSMKFVKFVFSKSVEKCFFNTFLFKARHLNWLRPSIFNIILTNQQDLRNVFVSFSNMYFKADKDKRSSLKS